MDIFFLKTLRSSLRHFETFSFPISSSDDFVSFNYLLNTTNYNLSLSLTPYCWDIPKTLRSCSILSSVTKKAYVSIGKINDEINEYEYYVNKGNKDKADRIKIQLISDWKELITWMEVKKFYNILIYDISYLII